MRIEKLTIERTENINIGDYESIKAGVTIEATLTEGQDYKQAFAKLSKLVDALWVKRMQLQLRQVQQRRSHERDDETQIRITELEETINRSKKQHGKNKSK